MAFTDTTLDDKYLLHDGRIFLSGVQALVRLPLIQSRRDRVAGLNTGGFISGYRGSPLGTYDTALWNARVHLSENNIHFEPAINEDLAATSVWGTQQVNLFQTAKVDGVFAIWYGKGPGADRSADVLKHANAAGSSRYGGVLAVVGDDHACHSSTLPHQSEQIFEAAMIPILAPASIGEIVDFGLLGIAMSRFSGCWVALKTVSELIDSAGTISVQANYPTIILPKYETPPGGLHIRWPDPALDQERRLHVPKMGAVAAFAQANRVDQIIWNPPLPRLGIAAAGKAYCDLRQALSDLGIDEREAFRLGLRLYKIGLTWPLNADAARRFADGLEVLLVVEEKRAFIENQFAKILFTHEHSRPPTLLGKCDRNCDPLLSSEGELSPLLIARAIVAAERQLGGGGSNLLPRLEALDNRARDNGAFRPTDRIPFFCSGCPHNLSTKLPGGSRAFAGIGCHGMVMQMPARRTILGTHMGGEGATWIGQSPFLSEQHVFQNLGDGTYQHSGLLALRAAAAAGVNITYKILYNDAVAMTGGQPVDGRPDVSAIARQVIAEGAREVAVVSDEPEKYARSALPSSCQIYHRRDLDKVQRRLRDIRGLTVLIYDQACAAEKRRRRKRGIEPEPAKHVVINEAVCEGCGDCGVASNCLSIRPLETEFGRKRTIDFSTCNKDFACLDGFCPSFVTVHHAERRRGALQLPAIASALPAALPVPLSRPYGIVIAGIGGSGVVTAGAMLGMAAHLEQLACTVLDQIGLAQKNGAVLSQVRIAKDGADLYAPRIGPQEADLLLACDMVVATGNDSLTTLHPGYTRAIVNTDLAPSAAFLMDDDFDFQEDAMKSRLKEGCAHGQVAFIPASDWATQVSGSTIGANLFMLGYACQRGLLPLRAESLLRAIELNAVSVDASKQTFAWGRFAAGDPEGFLCHVPANAQRSFEPPKTLKQVLDFHSQHLTAYQNSAYAKRFRELVDHVAEAERRVRPGREDLAIAVAKSLSKLMAVKDEYEVARLYTDGQFALKLNDLFKSHERIELHLAPPLISRMDPATGRPRKRAFGPWIFPTLRLLARLKGLRNTRWDPFSYTADRRFERELLAEYEELVEAVLRSLTAQNHAIAIELASLPLRIRGFGPVKVESAQQAKIKERELLRRYRELSVPQMHIA
jgi:indolepyruvate ferredoxin oxidoreductase